jgi:hypothetical protein
MEKLDLPEIGTIINPMTTPAKLLQISNANNKKLLQKMEQLLAKHIKE